MPRDLSTALWHRGRLWVIFEPRDFWVGVYVSRRAVFVCLVPCLAVKWERRPRPVLVKEAATKGPRRVSH